MGHTQRDAALTHSSWHRIRSVASSLEATPPVFFLYSAHPATVFCLCNFIWIQRFLLSHLTRSHHSGPEPITSVLPNVHLSAWRWRLQHSYGVRREQRPGRKLFAELKLVVWHASGRSYHQAHPLPSTSRQTFVSLSMLIFIHIIFLYYRILSEYSILSANKLKLFFCGFPWFSSPSSV